MKKTLFIQHRAPYGSESPAEQLDALLVAAAFGQKVSVLFQDDGQVVGCVQDKVYTTGAPCIVIHGYRRAGIASNITRRTDLRTEALAGHLVTPDHAPLGRRLLAMAGQPSR